ncbi:hypothetical protein EDC02_6953 [Micromonospora sp. Llam0]|nr:hypothetical protein EDC02_6953 [Micromonospora sp. Llam0]
MVSNSGQYRGIEVYAGAARIEQGRFRFATAGTDNELTSWITVDQPRLDLAPYEQARVEVTIAVPPKASEGERYAVIWAATDPDGVGTDDGTGADSGNGDGTGGGQPGDQQGVQGDVRQVHRVGIRVYLDVGMGGEPRSDFEIEGLLPARDDAGVPSLSARVRNTGGRAVDLTGEVALSDGPAGARAGPFPVVQGTTLLPGETGSVLVELPGDLPDGPWAVTVRLRSGTVAHEATGRLTFPGPGEVGVPASILSGILTAPTMMGGSLVLGLLVLGGLAMVARRVRSGARAA